MPRLGVTRFWPIDRRSTARFQETRASRRRTLPTSGFRGEVVGVVRATRMDFTAHSVRARKTRKKKRVKRRKEAEESGDRERTEQKRARERERERETERKSGEYAGGIIGVSSLPKGHNGPSWRVAKQPLLGW